MVSLDYMVNFWDSEVEFFGFENGGAVIAICSDPFGVWNHRTFASLEKATDFFYRRGFRW